MPERPSDPSVALLRGPAPERAVRLPSLAQDRPALSVLTPVFNGEAYLRRCWDLLRAQTFDDWEWVIVDDGSVDGTRGIASAFGDDRIRVESYSPNRGRGYARARALAVCRGDWIVVWDVDDLHCPDRLARVDQARRAGYDYCHSYAALASADLRIGSFAGAACPAGAPLAHLLHSTMACRRDLAVRIGYFQDVGRGTRPDLEAAEDYSLKATLSAHFRGAFLPEVLTIYLVDREVSASKSIACHRSILRQTRRMLTAGTLNTTTRQQIGFWLWYLAKLGALRALACAPPLHRLIRRVRRRTGAFGPPRGWAPPESRLGTLRQLCDRYRPDQ